MSKALSDEIAPYLPYLRRYARALTGDQKSGDSYVRACLEALIADESVLDRDLAIKTALYKLFHEMWSVVQPVEPDAAEQQSALERTAQERLNAMTAVSRQVLLLTTLEGFNPAEAAQVVSRSAEDVKDLIDEAIAEIDRQIATRVLIIEDEPLISMDLAEIVEGLGHEVTGVARTHAEAVEAAKEDPPGLVLADIQLADNSSGIDAVKDILEAHERPVIFITSFPEHLLTGQRPEPTFLITKPYDVNVVKAAISQALFFNSTENVAA